MQIDPTLAVQYLDVAETMLLALDGQGNITHINRKACEVLEGTELQILGLNWFDVFLLPEEKAEIRTIFDDLMAGRMEPAERAEGNIQTLQGSRRIISWHNTPVISNSGRIRGTLSSGEDVTDRVRALEEKARLEHQIYSARKLESLGALAGGIAHDYNNLLTAILGNVDLALDECCAANPTIPFLVEIQTAAQRAAVLAHQMLAFSGRSEFSAQELDLAETARQMNGRLTANLPAQATYRFELDAPVPPVKADPYQVMQLIRNLVDNAAEALGPTGGEIAVHVGGMMCGREFLKENGLDRKLPEGHYAFVEVADTGCGMDQSTVDRLFDPFFTTKFTGRGLGLSAVLGIARAHSGDVVVHSQPGRGSQFRVLFPALAK